MPIRRYSQYFPAVFIALDLIFLNSSFFIANVLRFGEIFYTSQNYLALQIVLNVLWGLVFFSSRLDQIHREQRLLDNLNKLLTALVINLALVFALWFIAKPYYYSREHLFYTYLLFTTCIVLWRSGWYFFIRYYRTLGYNLRNVVIAGYGQFADELIDHINRNPGLGYRFLGYFDNSRVGALGDLKALEKYSEDSIDVVFCCLPELESDELKGLIDHADSNLIKVKIISQFSKLSNLNLTVQNYGLIPVLNVNEIPLDNKLNRSIKRTFDIVFSGMVILTLLSWLIPIISVLIRLESPGPAFFKQLRHGKDNRQFGCFKFRTMVMNDEADTKQASKFDVRPGITGLAQAKGFRGETTELSAMSGRVKLDRFYVMCF